MLHEHQEQLKDKVNNLMRVIDHLGIEVNVCNKIIGVLEEKIAKMENHLCQCTDQEKGKEKEVV